MKCRIEFRAFELEHSGLGNPTFGNGAMNLFSIVAFVAGVLGLNGPGPAANESPQDRLPSC